MAASSEARVRGMRAPMAPQRPDRMPAGAAADSERTDGERPDGECPVGSPNPAFRADVGRAVRATAARFQLGGSTIAGLGTLRGRSRAFPSTT